MKIVDIFAEQLYSFVYKDEDGFYKQNEYDRLMDLWTVDVDYLRNYAKENNVKDINQFVEDRIEDADQIQDILEDIVDKKESLEYFFRPLYDTEIGIIMLSLQKGKTRRNKLRLYAIKIDEDCFVITGGAIKMSQAMQNHPDTNKELSKLKRTKTFLKGNGVSDRDSFYEFKNEL